MTSFIMKVIICPLALMLSDWLSLLVSLILGVSYK